MIGILRRRSSSAEGLKKTYDLVSGLLGAKNGGLTSGRCGGGRDGAPRPFGCRAVMIAHACVHGRFSRVGLAGQRRTALPAFNGCDARDFWGRDSPRSINRGKGKGESLTSPLSIHRSCCQPSPRLRAPPILVLLASLPIRCLPSFSLSPAMAPPQPIVVLEPLP
jgi:hypothetical protein